MKKMQKNVVKIIIFVTVFGPIVVTAALALLYAILWAISSLFLKIQGLVLDKMLPWIQHYGWVIIAVWAFVTVSALIVYICLSFLFNHRKEAQNDGDETYPHEDNIEELDDDKKKDIPKGYFSEDDE